MNEDYLSNALGAASMRLLELRLSKIAKVSTPSAGADITVTVPGGVIWEVLSFRARLATSAAVANRNPRINLADPDGISIFDIPFNFTATASQVNQYSAAIGLGAQISAATTMIPLPSPAIPLTSGFVFSTTTSGIDAADQWSNIRLIVREWSELDVVQEIMEMVENFDSITSRLVR